jgi:hypothetical protein
MEYSGETSIPLRAKSKSVGWQEIVPHKSVVVQTPPVTEHCTPSTDRMRVNNEL